MDPMTRSVTQAAVLAAISNVAAQYIDSNRAGTSLTLDSTRLFQFVLYAVMVTPVNYVWQRWLETKFPAYDNKLRGSKKEEFIDDFLKGKSSTVKDKPVVEDPAQRTMKTAPSELAKRQKYDSLNLQNTFVKFALDSTVGTVLNTIMFLVGFALIRGQDKTYIQNEVAEQFLPMFLAQCRVWPVVSIVNFTIIPLQYRMLVSQTVNVFWGIYLSLIADGTQKF